LIQQQVQHSYNPLPLVGSTTLVGFSAPNESPVGLKWAAYPIGSVSVKRQFLPMTCSYFLVYNFEHLAIYV
jgi:hypothetical protein